MASKPKAPRPAEDRLLAAARGGQINVLLKILQNEKVDLNVQDDEKSMNGTHWEERGPVPPGQEGKCGHTPLLWACHLHRTKIALALLDAGADPRIVNLQGETALHLTDGDDELIDKLVEKGGDVNARSNWGTTPLMRAMDAGDDAKVLRLLHHNADPTIRDDTGKTAYDRLKRFDRAASLVDAMDATAKRIRQEAKDKKERELHDAIEGATRTSRDITPMQPLKLKKPAPRRS